MKILRLNAANVSESACIRSGHIPTMTMNSLPKTGMSSVCNILQDPFPKLVGASERAWGCVRRPGSVYDPGSSHASSILLLFITSPIRLCGTRVWEDARAWRAMCVWQPSTPAPCVLPDPLAAGCWAGWLAPSRPHACVLFLQKKFLSLCLYLIFFLPLLFSISPLLLPFPPFCFNLVFIL